MDCASMAAGSPRSDAIGTLFRGLTVEVFLICIRLGPGMVDHAVTMLRRGRERESRHSGRRHLRGRPNIPSSLFLLLTPRAARSSGRSTLGWSSRVCVKPGLPPASEKFTVRYRTEPVRRSEYRCLEAMGNVIPRFGHG